MRRRTQTNPLATDRAYGRAWVVVQSPDFEEAIQAGHLECSHRRLRPDEDEQLTFLLMLAPARSEEQGERGPVDEGDQAEIDGQVTHVRMKTLSLLALVTIEQALVAPIAVQFRPDRLCQRLFDGRGAIEIEFTSEDKNRCFVPIPLEGQRKIVWPSGHGLRRCARTRPRPPSARSTNFRWSGLDQLIAQHDAQP
jgi:hypothetical protein